jgi:hypothetical protein
MSDQLPARPADAPRALRVVALTAVCIGVLALAGAAFVLSYAGIHAVARQAGVSAQLARGYPVMFDVLLMIVLAAALALRGAGWPSKLLVWVTLLALLAAGAGADAWHAAGRRLPARPAAVTAAILPWALVLIAFVLLLVMLRHARLRRAAAADRGAAIGGTRQQWQPQVPSPLPTQPLVPGFAARSAGPGRAETVRLAVPRQVTAASAADTMANEPGLSGQAGALSAGGELAIATNLAPDDPGSDETALDPADGALPYPEEPYLPVSYLAVSDPTESYPTESYPTESYPTESDLAVSGPADSDLAASRPADSDLAASRPADSDLAARAPAEFLADEPAEADREGGDAAGAGADESSAAGDAPDAGPYPEASLDLPASPDPEASPDAPASPEPADATIGTLSPARTEADPAGENAAADPEMPVFHRMWSTPTSPAADAE